VDVHDVRAEAVDGRERRGAAPVATRAAAFTV
jgi:hypothetical protein